MRPPNKQVNWTKSKREFLDRLLRASELARQLAEIYVEESLPIQLVYSLAEYDDPRGVRGPDGTLKFLRGRFVGPDQLQCPSRLR